MCAEYRPLNRGTKLKARTIEPETVQLSLRPSLLMMHTIEERTKFEQIGRKRLVVRRGNSRREDWEENPYADVKIEEIWAPLTTLEDVKRSSSAVYTLKSRALPQLAHTTMEMIEEEARLGRMFERLSDLVDMDDPVLSGQASLQTEGPSAKVMGGVLEGVPSEQAKELRELLYEHISSSQEIVRQLTAARAKVLMAYKKKKKLARKLLGQEEEDEEED